MTLLIYDDFLKVISYIPTRVCVYIKRGSE